LLHVTIHNFYTCSIYLMVLFTSGVQHFCWCDNPNKMGYGSYNRDLKANSSGYLCCTAKYQSASWLQYF